jgi:hypothetical protein
LTLVSDSLCEKGDIEFQSNVSGAVAMLTNSESAVVHSAVRARILRAMIRSDPEQTRVPSERRFLVNQVVHNSDSDAIIAEWKAVEKAIPPQDVDAVGIWGMNNFSPGFIDTVERFGKECADPGNFQSSLLALVTCTNYSEAIRRNIVAGGDNCGRAMFLGACFGAAFGLGQVSGIPADWVAKTERGEEVLQRAISLFEDNKENSGVFREGISTENTVSV